MIKQSQSGQSSNYASDDMDWYQKCGRHDKSVRCDDLYVHLTEIQEKCKKPNGSNRTFTMMTTNDFYEDEKCRLNTVETKFRVIKFLH